MQGERERRMGVGGRKWRLIENEEDDGKRREKKDEEEEKINVGPQSQ